MEFRILGALEVRDGDAVVPLGGIRQRSVLAALVLNAGELLPTDRLVADLWGDDPPEAATKTVQVYVSRLRKLLGQDTIVTRPPGYIFEVDPSQIDLFRFESLAADGRRALEDGNAALASERFAKALALWRGTPLSDFAYERFALAEAGRLEELRLAVLEDRVEADLRCGRAAELVAELQSLAARHPLRERFRAQLMLALYRSARQAEALDVYRDARATMVEELGIEPGPALQDLERAILNQDPALAGGTTARQPRRGTSSFVGREEQVGGLLTALDRARSGRGSMFLVSGEPGIGKSRLADEVAAHALDRGMRVLRGRCWEAGGAPGYWPWVQVLRSYVRSSEPNELRRRLDPGAAELAELLPELRDLLGDLPPAPVRDPEALRFRMFDSVAAVLRAVGEEHGLLVTLDDLHAADEPSLLLLEFLAGAARDAGLVILGGYRDTSASPTSVGHAPSRALARLSSEPGVERVELEGLGRADVGDYIEFATGRRAPDGVVETIHKTTSGNALFVVEAVRLLGARDGLSEADAGALVPGALADAIERRLEGLDDATREVLTTASVLGREFDPDLLERMADEQPVVTALDTAIRARLVEAAAGTPGALRFSHAVVRDALYAAIPTRDRRELHRRTAGTLEGREVADVSAHLSTLAHHFFEAADMERATHYATLAAQRAAAQLAYEEAARLYRVALSASERGSVLEADGLCDVLLGLGDAQARGGDHAGAQETFLRAAESARAAGSAERLGRAALGYGGRWVWTVMRGDPHIIPLLEEAIDALPTTDSALRARLLARLAGGPLKALGDATRERRFEMSSDAVEMARRLGDPVVLAWTLDGRKVAIWGPDTLEEHWALIDELRVLAEQAGDPEQLVDAHICSLIKLFGRSEVERFDAVYARATVAAEGLRQPGQRWLVAVMAPLHALLVGRLGDAEQLIERAYAIGREAAPWNAIVCAALQRFVLAGLLRRPADIEQALRSAAAENPLYAPLPAALAALYADLGDVPNCRSAFEGLAADDFAAVPVDEEWLLTIALLADACAFLGDTERAALLYQRLEPFGNRMAVAPIEIGVGSAARPLGKLAATIGRPDDAYRWFDRAARDNDRAGARPWAAHARREHAEFLVAMGESDAAASLLRSAESGYRAVGMEAWAARCRAAFAERLPA